MRDSTALLSVVNAQITRRTSLRSYWTSSNSHIRCQPGHLVAACATALLGMAFAIQRTSITSAPCKYHWRMPRK